jgi:hypothetical protein
MENIDLWSSKEHNEWLIRYENIQKIILDLSHDTLVEVNTKITNILVDYFADFPVIEIMLNSGTMYREAYPILIPVTEDVLTEMDLMK